jgi:hypothetical protein
MAYTITQGSGTTMAADVYGSAAAPSSGQQVPWVGLAPGTAGALAPVSSSNPIHVAQAADLISVTLSLDTSAYTSGDLIADAQEVASVFLTSGGQAELVSVLVVDEDDQKAAIDIYLTSSSSSWGTENSAPTITDAVARSIQAHIPIANADYKDLGGVSVAQPRVAQNVGVICEGSASTSLYIAVVSNGSTPTYTASGVKVILGFRRL